MMCFKIYNNLSPLKTLALVDLWGLVWCNLILICIVLFEDCQSQK